MLNEPKINYFKFRQPQSIGPLKTCQKLAYLVYYAPYLWRKVARYMSNIRRLHRVTFTNDDRYIKYACQAFKDTKLPWIVQTELRNAVYEEFGFDPGR